MRFALAVLLLILLPGALAGQKMELIALERLDTLLAHDTSRNWIQVFSSETKISYDSAWRHFRSGKAVLWKDFPDWPPSFWYQDLSSFLPTARRYYWLLFAVENRAAEPYPLLITGLGLDSSWVQQRSGNRRKTHVIAYYCCPDSSGILQRQRRQEVIAQIPPGQADTLLVRVHGYAMPREFRPTLHNALLYEAANNARKVPGIVGGGLISGLILGVLLYCLLNYARTRDPVLLWYGLFCALLLFSAIRTLERSFPHAALIMCWFNWFETKVVILALLTLSYYQFILRFLEPAPPYFRQVVRAVTWACLGAIATDMVLMSDEQLFPISYLFYQSFRVAAVLLGLSLVLPFWLSAGPLMRIVLIGSSFLLLGEALSILFNNHLISDLATPATVLVDVVFFTAAIAYRNRRQMRENQQLQIEVERERRRNAELALEAQRKRAAVTQNLHDYVQNQLMRIILFARLPHKGEEAVKGRLGEISNAATEANELISRIIAESDDALLPSAPDRDAGGVEGAPIPFAEFQRQCQRFAQAFRKLMPVEADFPPCPEEPPLSSRLVGHLMGILHECQTNILKHSGATQASLRMACLPGPELLLEVGDNGRGLPDLMPRDGTGLSRIRNRVTAIGGTLEIQSAPGQGVRVQVRVGVGGIGA